MPYRAHNKLVYLINKCDSINCILEKRCVKLLWNLFNRDNVLFNRMLVIAQHLKIKKNRISGITGYGTP